VESQGCLSLPDSDPRIGSCRSSRFRNLCTTGTPIRLRLFREMGKPCRARWRYVERCDLLESSIRIASF
jgi:hypothetical protein